jgi:hypothetical protein
MPEVTELVTATTRCCAKEHEVSRWRWADRGHREQARLAAADLTQAEASGRELASPPGADLLSSTGPDLGKAR